MAMLAEPRRKEKWSVNPRGKEWSGDSNKFGQRMLEKMGWTAGKGLGVNEQGITEHVRLSPKNDSTGIGFKKSVIEEAWTRQQDDFNEFLLQLQESQDLNVISVEGGSIGRSLELKSKQSRARVHYQKFTRGKDVEKYTSKDLANIFGRRHQIVDETNKQKSDDENAGESKESRIVRSRGNEGGLITINAGSMADYFKNKQFSGDASTKKNGGESDLQIRSRDSSSEEATSRESNFDEIKSLKKTKRKTELTDERISKKQRKEKIDGFVNQALDLDVRADESHNGKEYEVTRMKIGLSNRGLDLSDELSDSQSREITLTARVEYTNSEPRNERKILKSSEETRKKKQNKSKETLIVEDRNSGFVNEALESDAVSEEINDNELNERKTNRIERKKEVKTFTLETIEETPEVEILCENQNYPPLNMSQKKKKKKRRKEEESKTIDCTPINTETKKHTKTKNNITEFDGNEGRILSVGEEVKDDVDNNFLNEDFNDKSIRNRLESSRSIVKTTETEIVTETVRSESESESEPESESQVVVTEATEATKAILDKEKSIIWNNISKTKRSTGGKLKETETSTKMVDDVRNADYLETRRGKNYITSKDKDSRISPHEGCTNEKSSKPRMSKKMLITLFHRNSVLNFPGSNVHKIRGYGKQTKFSEA